MTEHGRVIRAGFLPLYLELYDTVIRDFSTHFAGFLNEIEQSLLAHQVQLERVAPCCRAEQVSAAVQAFDAAGVDLIMTLHLSYSPSLLSIDALESTRTPLLLLDTTVDETFDASVDPARIMFNHGIHGVQDLASVLRRRSRAYQVTAGHFRDADFLARVVSGARAAAAANRLRGMRVLRVGASFEGMGDFFVEEEVLRKQLGVEVVATGIAPLREAAAALDPEMIDAEVSEDRRLYIVEATEETHRGSVVAGLALEKVIGDLDCGACSFNFLAFSEADGPLNTVPFLGASKLMAKGYGYAGEGDVLTAALLGALAPYFLSNFTEMFCPDWHGNAVFLSHMGEFNPACAEGPVHLVEKDFPWTGARNPAILTGGMRKGAAVLVNLAPGPAESFSLLLANVEVLGDATHPDMRTSVRGWMRPSGSLAGFLEWYSAHGGTHHCVLVHGDAMESLRQFALQLGLACHSFE